MGILDTPSYSRASADAIFAQANRPAGAVAAGSRGQWDPARFVYNKKPSNTKKLQALLGRGLSGVGAGSLLFDGDSLQAGFQGNVVAPTLNSLAQASPAAVLRRLFVSGGYAIKGTGPIVANPRGASWTSSASQLDSRYTFTGTWTNQASNVNGVIETASGTVEFTDTAVTDATIVEFCCPLLNASFEWFVDNVSQGTVVQGSASGALQRYSATGLTPGVHTIKIVRTAGTLRLVWCEIRRAGGGIQIGNLAVGGSTTLIWDRTEAYFPGPVVNNYLPTVCGHDLGTNDWGSGASPSVSAATFKTQSLSILNKQIALGIEPFLITSNPTEGKDYTPYNEVKYELADQLDIWLFDFYEVCQSYTVMNTQGMMSDPTHPEYAGYALKGLSLFRALTGAS